MGYEIMFIGLVLALGYVSLTGYYPGGIIVPGYLVLFVDQPFRMAGTLAAALLTLALYLLASRHLILFENEDSFFLYFSEPASHFFFHSLLLLCCLCQPITG
jgi:gamma-polyglutamate biosynthesis protein CapC